MVDGIQELISALQTDTYETSKTYGAEVSSIDSEGTVWVYLAGSTMETPTVLSSTEVSVGDYVNVEWRNNKLYIAGNVSNPSAGAVRVTAVEQAAQIANQAAQNAVADADVARQAAESAQDNAVRAQGSAEDAQASADNAKQSAGTALDQLGIVQDVVGVLALLSNKAEYQVTTDEEVQGGKWYFTREGTSPEYLYHVVDPPPQSVYHLTEDTSVDSGKTYYSRSGTGTEQDPYVYTEVQSPVVADIGTYYEKYYEMVGIDASVKDYITSRLVVTSDGLTIQDPTMQTRILLSPKDGVVLTGANGKVVGKYGATAQIGDTSSFHIEMDGTELGFYQAENKVAYISNQQLYISQSVVLQQMDLGEPYNGVTGFGQWSWKVHKNANGYNNLNLKWIG